MRAATAPSSPIATRGWRRPSRTIRTPSSPHADAVLVDNRYPDYVLPICEAARRRDLPLLIATATGRRSKTIRCFAWRPMSSFHRNACAPPPASPISAKVSCASPRRPRPFSPSATVRATFSIWMDGGLRHSPVFKIAAVDTLGAGDAFHGGFLLALAEGRSVADAMRFGSAVAGIKCTRIGGSAGSPDAGRGRGAVGGAAVAGRRSTAAFRAGIGLRRRDAGILELDLEYFSL